MTSQPRAFGRFDLEVATTASGDARDAFLQVSFRTNKDGKRRASVGDGLPPKVVLGL